MYVSSFSDSLTISMNQNSIYNILQNSLQSPSSPHNYRLLQISNVKKNAFISFTNAG